MQAIFHANILIKYEDAESAWVYSNKEDWLTDYNKGNLGSSSVNAEWQVNEEGLNTTKLIPQVVSSVTPSKKSNIDANFTVSSIHLASVLMQSPTNEIRNSTPTLTGINPLPTESDMAVIPTETTISCSPSTTVVGSPDQYSTLPSSPASVQSTDTSHASKLVDNPLQQCSILSSESSANVQFVDTSLVSKDVHVDSPEQYASFQSIDANSMSTVVDNPEQCSTMSSETAKVQSMDTPSTTDIRNGCGLSASHYRKEVKNRPRVDMKDLIEKKKVCLENTPVPLKISLGKCFICQKMKRKSHRLWMWIKCKICSKWACVQCIGWSKTDSQVRKGTFCCPNCANKSS